MSTQVRSQQQAWTSCKTCTPALCRWATQTGQDFTNNTNAKGVDFGGIHVWPDNWEMCVLIAMCCMTQVRLGFAAQPLGMSEPDVAESIM